MPFVTIQDADAECRASFATSQRRGGRILHRDPSRGDASGVAREERDVYAFAEDAVVQEAWATAASRLFREIAEYGRLL